MANDPDVYVTVQRPHLQPEAEETGEPHGGRWYLPGETYPMRLSAAKQLHAAEPKLGVAWETAEGHHEKSRVEAKRQATEAEKSEK